MTRSAGPCMFVFLPCPPRMQEKVLDKQEQIMYKYIHLLAFVSQRETSTANSDGGGRSDSGARGGAC